ncbi:MAG: hypothetical protein Fur0034_12730 [Desulfuromonadia bacterium]
MTRRTGNLLSLFLVAHLASSSVAEWYKGDDRCPPPPRDGRYAPPYRAEDHPTDPPTFPEADLPGWSCSYLREDGTIVQYGDSRTPREQWLAIWGNDHDRSP